MAIRPRGVFTDDPGQKRVQILAMQECTALCRQRRGLALSGAQTVAALLKLDSCDRCMAKTSRSRPQVATQADLIDEPRHDTLVHMLEALSVEEADFYAREENVVDMRGKSLEVFKDLQDKLGFVGGCKQQYEAYFSRSNLPESMWDFVLEEDVKAVVGFSCVGKKNGLQRKLLMACCTNYLMEDVRKRAQLGLHGGAALANIYMPSGCLDACVFDQSNAFTSILTPSSFWSYHCTPPIRAGTVWNRLSPAVRAKCARGSWVFPRYKRLAMGLAHAVSIIMNINMTCVGRAFNASRLLVDSSSADADEESSEEQVVPAKVEVLEQADIGLIERGPLHPSPVPLDSDDFNWKYRRRTKVASGPKLSPQEWLDGVRKLKQSDTRTLTALHLFGGQRRHKDIEFYVCRGARQKGMAIHFTTVDLARDAKWDLANPAVFSMVMEAVEEGLVDVVLGGPPCSTWSIARHFPGGPRPVRSRGKYVWGLPNLREHEKARVSESNVLTLNTLAAMEGVSLRGGGHLLEHPADPGEDPFSSIFSTDEVHHFEARTSSSRRLLHQCMCGCSTRKATNIYSNLVDNHVFDLVCDGKHLHTFEHGRDGKGGFDVTKLQEYPTELCRLMAECVLKTFAEMLTSGSGPTGWRRTSVPSQRIASWSTTPEGGRQFGVQIVNESVARGQGCVLAEKQLAFYLHVDDGLMLADGAGCPGAVPAASLASRALEAEGFVVGEMERLRDRLVVIGYDFFKEPAIIRFPDKKGAMLQDTLRYLLARHFVQVDLLRSCLGIWIWGTLLRRDLLCVPHGIFSFCERFEGRVVPWWPSVRDEVAVMAALVPAMHADLGAPMAPVCFASDAQGANDVDSGGWGIAAADVSEELSLEMLRNGFKPGYNVVKLNGEFGGLKRPDLHIRRAIPFTRLPEALFSETWHPVGWGRWAYADHITLGEMRAVLKVARAIAAVSSAHRHRFFSFQGNGACSGACAKGRSCAPALNFLLRKKSAPCIAANILMLLPWAESVRQPAGGLSRLCKEGLWAPSDGPSPAIQNQAVHTKTL